MKKILFAFVLLLAIVLVFASCGGEDKPSGNDTPVHTHEFAEWDFDLLEQELDGLDFEGFDFGFEDDPIDTDVDIKENNQKESKEKEIECPYCGGTILL